MTKCIRRNFNASIALVTLIVMMALAPFVFATDKPATQGIPIMLNAASALNATGTVLGTGTMTNCRESAVYIQWSAGTSAGGVTVETAHDSAYTGTWATLGAAIPWVSASREDVLQITGIHGAIRTRISTLIVGGTVSSWIVCN